MADDLKCTIIDKYCKLFDVYNRGDIDTLVQYYTTDCRSITTQSTHSGREGLKETCKELAANGVTYNFKKEECDVVISDDGSMAYLTAKIEACKTDGTKCGSGTNLCIFRKIDGDYLVSFEMYC
ncbi:uncharacterized protein LOC144438277 [Glandiceps talaboti]